MIKKIIILFGFLILLPVLAFPDCNEDCYNSKCDIPDACEMKCENNICYYYDDDGNCWKYDKDHGYYPCGCECYQCDDSCFENNDDHDHHHDHDDDWDDDYWSCFIQAIH